ncbi:MAG: transglutaminase family protein [bacterium]|nr:transglutaminase family protein [bacterium]
MFSKLKSAFICRQLIIFFLLLISLISLLPKNSLAAEEFSYKTEIDYHVNENSVTKITESYKITNNTPRQYLTNLKISTPTDEVNNLKVRYVNGGDIPFSLQKKSTDFQGYKYEYQEIDINFNRQNAGKGLTWSFEVSYETSKLVETKGASHTVYIPAITPSEDVQDYSITLSVPQSFGQPHPTGAKPSESSMEENQELFTFNPRDLVNQAVAIVFGDSTTYNINFNFPLKNDTDTAKTFTVALPPDMANQKVFVNSIDPAPISTKLDEDGNILADFKIGAHQNVTVKTDISALVKYLEYDLGASGKKTEIPANLTQKYTKPTRYWQANNPEILVKAKSLSHGDFNVATAVKETNKYVIDALNYNNEKIKYNIRQGAITALKNPGNAVCLEYSDLMIALLRAQGIPARMPIGYAYSGNLKNSDSVSDSLHSWVEVYVPSIGWMVVDPTWGEKFDNFGKSDMDHFTFAIWGQSDDKPVAVSLNNVDQNYQYENALIKYLKQAPIAVKSGKIKVSKWVIAPLVSLLQFSARAPDNVAGDNYAIKFNSGSQVKKTELGSLAPAQVVSSFAAMFGLSFTKNLDAVFVQSGESGLILASAQAKPNYLPLIILVLIISGFVIYKLVKLVSNKNKQRFQAARQLNEKTDQDSVNDAEKK